MFGGRRSYRSSRNSESESDGGGEHQVMNTPSSGSEVDDKEKKLYSRLVSKDNSFPSVRVYYGEVSVAVPFTWESQPGTPKYQFSDDDDHHHLHLPPLTPPPSYFSTSTPHLKNHSSSSSRFLHVSSLPNSCRHFITFLLTKTAAATSSLISSSSDSLASASSFTSLSSSSSSSTLVFRRRHRKPPSTTGSLLDLKVSDQAPAGSHGSAGSGSGSVSAGSGSGSGSSSPTSIMCFGGSSWRRGRYGCL